MPSKAGIVLASNNNSNLCILNYENYVFTSWGRGKILGASPQSKENKSTESDLDVKTKYISINMLPNGSKPPIMETTEGVKYHFFTGIGRGIVLTRHGLFGAPLQFLPMTVPSSARGKEMNPQMTKTTTIVPKGMAANDP
nr:hypothetical protein Iba_chr06aCG3260 [Ipomoea batatas]GMD11313.1 hypothetical protein Iba_chr06fCG2520 [Ipomoea batatas]